MEVEGQEDEAEVSESKKRRIAGDASTGLGSSTDRSKSTERKEKVDKDKNKGNTAKSAQETSSKSGTTRKGGKGDDQSTAQSRQILRLSRDVAYLMSITNLTFVLPEDSVVGIKMKETTGWYANAIKKNSGHKLGQPSTHAAAALVAALVDLPTTQSEAAKILSDFKESDQKTYESMFGGCRITKLSKGEFQLVTSPTAGYWNEKKTQLWAALEDSISRHSEMRRSGPAPRNTDERQIQQWVDRGWKPNGGWNSNNNGDSWGNSSSSSNSSSKWGNPWDKDKEKNW